jgi:hypothetical protein
MNILEGATLYLDNKPLKGDPAKHFGALSEASKQGRAVGFTQARPPRLLVTLFTDLAGEEALSNKLLELISADVTPTFILDGPSGLSSYYLIEEVLGEREWRRLGEVVAKQYGGTPAAQEEILPLPGFRGTTLLYASDAPLTRDALMTVFPTKEAGAAQPASVQPREVQNDPQALREAIEMTDLPALVAHHYPESGAKPGIESAVKAVWRGDENPSFSLFKSNNGGAWLYRDHGTGEKGNAFGFLVDILQMPRAEAAEALKGGGFVASRTPAPVRQTPEKVKPAVKKPTIRSRIVKTYAYTDEHYNLLFEVVRFTPKRFAQRRRDPETGAWVWGLKAGGYIKGANGDWVIPKNGEPAELEFPACRHVLYRLPKLVATASSGETVYLVEGEKDVETLESFDLTATCNPMGSLKWDESYTEVLKGRRVVNLRDNDEAGEKHAALVAEALQGETIFSSFLLPGLPAGGDVTHWFDVGNTLRAFLELTSPQQQVSEASYEEMQTALWQIVNAGTVQPFVHPLSNMELTPSNAHFCLKDALETPQKKDSWRVISRAYSMLPNAGTPMPMPQQAQEGIHA